MFSSIRSGPLVRLARKTGLLSLLIFLPTSSACPQPNLREIAITESKASRYDARQRSLAETQGTCVDRVRYDDDGLHLQVGQFPLLRFSGVMTLRDRIEVLGDGEGLLLNSEFHLLKQCNQPLGLYIVEVNISTWSETTTETIIVALDGSPWSARFFGAPFPSPDSNAIAFVPDHGRGSRNKVEIALRDTMSGWGKVWEYSPPDGYVWSFIRWNDPNRFSILMRSAKEQWESVFEFTPTSLIRTDGPKTVVKPNP